MAIYYARANGNVNATNVWSTTAGGATSDLFPSFTNADTLMANGFTITLNVNTTVLEIRTDTTGGATAGGGFTLNAGVTLNANLYAGTTVCVSYSSNSGSATINGNSTGGSSSNAHGISMSGNSTLNINGNITGGSGSNASGISISGASSITNITGTINAGSTTYGLLNYNGSILNIVGSIVGNSGSNATIYNVATSCIINITGNITSTTVPCVQNQAAATINITGNAVGGNVSTAQAIQNGSNGTINIIGIVTGGSVGIGATNSSTGTLTVTRAKGNGFGNGSVGLNSVVGVSASQGGLTRVYEIEYGDLGQSPTSGPVFLFPASSNVALFYRSGTSKKTLVDASSSSGLLPNASDVRSGVTYNAGTNTGTMAVPAAASVALGVSVDNTTGTAILTSGNIADIWNYPVSGISVSNSIGERLKNCSTVATMGQQLAAALNNVQ